ncbi:virulence factor TspB C-terminal domain-related protein [Pseudomonas knackmussii]|uniref:virulence factor TspB C-terminal domain-related protein n=1 Tax=Pseudomonas knackmussii TaxID=65741 RepID=UPI001F33941F|nr:virulence factor TspB C-terminal domain-related protein [Pseudomonas knackmussii]
MRNYLSLIVAVLALPAFATERIQVDPYIKAGPGYTAATGSITGYVPSKSNQQLLLDAERKGWLGTAAAKTPVTVKPRVTVPIGSMGTKLGGLLRSNAGQLAMSAAISAALAGVGWVMSDDNTKAQKKSDTVDGVPVSGQATCTLDNRCTDACAYPAAEVLGKIKVVTTSDGSVYAIGAFSSGTSPGDGVPSGYTHVNNCTNRTLGFDYNHATGYWPVSGSRTISIGEIESLKTDLTDDDLAALNPWLNAQSAEWLKGLLSDMCGGAYGTLNPQACYDDLQKQSQAIISGPSSVQGPKLTSTGTYNRPDGTLGSTATTTSTTYNIRYGDSYYDYDTVTTKTTTQDGTQTSQETTTDQGDPQQKPDEDKPDEEEKPERLASGEPCDVPLSCSGDAIDCAVLTQEKALRCAYEKQSDYDKHKDEIKAAVTGQKFEIDDSSEIQIPSFINQGTRFLPAACPTANTFSLQTGGGRSFTISYQPLCSLASDLGYLIVIAVGCFCVLYVGRSLGGE